MMATVGHDLLFYLMLHLFFFGMGWPLRRLVPAGDRGVRGASIAVLGLAAAVIASQLLYTANLRVPVIAALLSMVAAMGVGHAAARARRARIGGPAALRLAVLAAAALAIALPRFTGGQQFSVFQGNHWDQFGYLEPAITYGTFRHDFIEGHSDLELEQEGGFLRAKWQLDRRPGVRILYAVVCAADARHFLQNGYLFICVFFSLGMGILTAMFDRVGGVVSVRAPMLAFCVLGGFWGAFVVDINAWSQAAAIPLLLLAVLQVCRAGHPAALAVSIAGAMYLYPEGTAYHLPALGAAAGLIWLREPRAGRASRAVIAAGLAALLVAPAATSTVGFLFRQISKVAGPDTADWWRYFFRFLFGRDGVNGNALWNGVDGLWSGLGMYVFTPPAGWGPIAAAAARLAAVSVMVAMGAAVWTTCRAPGAGAGTRRARLGLAVVTGLLVTQMALLYAMGEYWAAGKALSYCAPLVLTLLLLPLAAPFAGRRMALVATGAFALAQAVQAAARPVYAARNYGVHYAEPYPAAQNAALKQHVDWADLTFLDALVPDDFVAIDVDDPWVRAYVRMALIGRGIPYFCMPPVYRNERQEEIVGYTTPTGTPTAEVSLVGDSREDLYRFRITVRRLEPATAAELEAEGGP